jgi:hypothetical protein
MKCPLRKVKEYAMRKVHPKSGEPFPLKKLDYFF